MYTFGLSLLALFYFGVGGLLGEFLHALALGRVADSYQDSHGLLVAMVIGNLVGLPCLVLLFKQRHREPRLESLGQPQQVLLKGLPINSRIAFLLLSVAWVIGFAVSILFAI